MTGDVIDFATRKRLSKRIKPRSPAWVPEYKIVNENGIGVRYWTGREVQCLMEPNPDFGRSPYATPFIYIATFNDSGQVTAQMATPPPCKVKDFDWDRFEREWLEA